MQDKVFRTIARVIITYAYIFITDAIKISYFLSTIEGI